MHLTKKEKEIISHLNNNIDKIKGPKSRLGFFKDVFNGFTRTEKEDVITFKGDFTFKLSIAVIAEVENYFKNQSSKIMRERHTSNFQSLMPHQKERIVLGCAVLIIHGIREEKKVSKDIKKVFTDAENATRDNTK